MASRIWIFAHRWWSPTLLGFTAMLAGCAADPYLNQHIEATNAEYRALEDYVNQLEHENDELCSEVDRLAEENERLKKGEAPRSRGTTRSPARERGPDSLEPPRIENPNLEVPQIELPGNPPPVRPPGAFTPPPGATRAPSLAPADAGTRARPVFEEEEAPAPRDEPAPPVMELPPPSVQPAPPAKPVEPEPIDGRVTHLFLHPSSGGVDFDPRPGDDGVRIVLEPRNRQDQFVSQPGAVSIALLDPSKQGDAARVALWTFSGDAIGKKISRSGEDRGVVLQLPWPAKAPDQAKLRLFVRYVTPDGRQLRQERDVFITTPSQFSQRWTPRNGERLASPAVRAPAGQPPPQSPPPAEPTRSAANPRSAEPQPTAGEASPSPAVTAAPTAATASAAPSLLEPPAALGQPESKPPARPEWKPFR